MRRRKCLVQIHVNDIELHITRPNFSENSVQISAVVIQQPASIVNKIGNLLDTAFEHSQSRRIRQHDAGRFRTNRRFECIEVDIAFRSCRHFPDNASAHCRCGRIGSVRRVGTDDFDALMIAARFMVRLDHRNTSELALSTCHWRQ